LAGADLVKMFKVRDAKTVFEQGAQIQAIFRAQETGKKPFVAAINGTALGGGFEVCLACHRRIAADNPKAQIGLPEVSIGLLPGAGGTQRLPRLIGPRAALPLIMEGKRLSPQAALKAGLVDEVVPAGELIEAAKRWLRTNPPSVQPWDKPDYKLPGGPVWSPGGIQTFMGGTAMLRSKTFGNYPAPKAILSAVYEGLQVPFDVALKIESRWFTSLALSPEAQAMIRTLFFGMQDANKLKRRPAGPAPTKYTKVGVLGAGMMGAGIAYASAMAGLETVLLDTSQASADKGKAYSQGLLDKRVATGKMKAAERDAILARIKPTTDFADLKGCELVVEAVFEDRGIKADVTRKSEAVIAADAVFASNTSTLPITGLAEASSRPENFIGLHFFSPVDKMPLVEIIRGKKTSDAALAKAMDYVKRIRKTPIVVNDSRGFYTSRVFATYVNEGLALLAEGAAPALIDNAGKMAGMPVGPLALSDEVSLDLMHKVAKQTRADLGNKYREMPGGHVINLMVEQLGRVGKKAGKGFYSYPESGKKHLWPDLAKHFPRAKTQPTAQDAIKRMLYIQAIETVRCLEENVVTNAQDADVGSILGWGFAPHTGGVLSMIDGVGVARFTAECETLAKAHGERFTPPKLLKDMAAKGECFYPAKTAEAA
ncbi:MAG: 3-hydroxyacyl-CoA dehydrogenase, partial [Alphaproteobacteria bacterium]|nr:3-hydroxyacyl-CoA dehydrogenase [Alphaproteobacteria bacterium]